jgi:hypothetical protein
MTRNKNDSDTALRYVNTLQERIRASEPGPLKWIFIEGSAARKSALYGPVLLRWGHAFQYRPIWVRFR